MSFLDITGEIILLAAGMLLLLWGLRIFKIYIICGGVMIGTVVGLTIGLYSQQSEMNLMIITLVGALGGGIIAWPMQKTFVLLLTGLFSALTGAAVVYALGLSTDNWQTTGLIAFTVGGLIALILFDYIIIILMAFSGAQLIFWRDHLELLIIRRDMIRNFDFSNYINSIIHVVEQNLFYFLFLSLIFILFAIYFQKRQKVKSGDTEDNQRKKTIFRRTTYILMFILLVAWPYAESELSKQTYPLIGYDFLSWPFVVIITSFFIFRLKKTKIRPLHSIPVRFILLIIFGLTIVPFIGCLVDLISRLYPDIHRFTEFYAGFNRTGTLLRIYKIIYSAVLFPLLFMLPAIRHRAKLPPSEEKEEKKENRENKEDRIDSSDMNAG